MGPSLPSRATPLLPLGAAAAGVAALAVLVRLPFASWPISPDEGGYAVGAYWWARGVTLYSDDLWFDRPQGIFVVYRLGEALFGSGVEAIRLWGAIWFAVGAVAVWALTRAMLDERTALIAGALTAVASASPFVEGATANAEAFMVTATTLSALALWRRQFVVAGLCAGLAIQLKPSGGAAVALAAFWLVHSRAGVRDWLRFGLPVTVPLFAGAIHGWMTVGIGTYLDAAFLFRLEHPVDQQLARLRWGVLNSALLTLPLAFATLGGLGSILRTARGFWAVWFLTSFAGVAMGGNWWPHYFSQLVPPMCVAAAALVDRLLRDRRRPELALWACVLSVLALSSARFALLGPDSGSKALYDRPGLEVEAEIGTFIRDNSSPDDRIYVAFTEPGVNYHAERLSSVPWLYIQQLAEVEGAYDRVMETAAAGLPRYVVIMKDRPALAPAIADLLEAMGDRYELHIGYPAADLYRRR